MHREEESTSILFTVAPPTLASSHQPPQLLCEPPAPFESWPTEKADKSNQPGQFVLSNCRASEGKDSEVSQTAVNQNSYICRIKVFLCGSRLVCQSLQTSIMGFEPYHFPDQTSAVFMEAVHLENPDRLEDLERLPRSKLISTPVLAVLVVLVVCCPEDIQVLAALNTQPDAETRQGPLPIVLVSLQRDQALRLPDPLRGNVRTWVSLNASLENLRSAVLSSLELPELPVSDNGSTQNTENAESTLNSVTSCTCKGTYRKDIMDLEVGSRYAEPGQFVVKNKKAREVRNTPNIPCRQAQQPQPTSGVLRFPYRHLTRREEKVARFVADGLSNAEIAAQLGITISTVKVHLQNVFQKTEIKRRSQSIGLFMNTVDTLSASSESAQENKKK